MASKPVSYHEPNRMEPSSSPNWSMPNALPVSFCLPGTKSYARCRHDIDASAGLFNSKVEIETMIEEEEGNDASWLWPASREKMGISAAP